MFTSLASLFLNKPVRHDIAMTGEITLRGLVLPIGGLKEKTLAAKRAGIREVIVPERNHKDLPDLPDEVKETLQFHFVNNVDEVLSIALSVKPRGMRSAGKTSPSASASRGSDKRRKNRSKLARRR
jgi:ATP-dependent Lon protease